MKKVFIFAAFTLIFSSCSIHRSNPHSNYNTDSKFQILINEGTVCLKKENSTTLRAIYYPLNNNCLPSNLHSWKMNSIDLKNRADGVEMQTYSLHKLVKSTAALTDCKGAGIKISRIQVPNGPTTVYWDKAKLATINSNQRVCFKRVGNSYIRVKGFKWFGDK